jgi:uncharacterized membrane protein YeaQ/YmgE (transglycosylase-associated protein family)
MKKDSLSVLLACGFGALIGALSTIEIRSHFMFGLYICPLGAFFGGFVAYCVVDFRQLCAGIARACHEVVAWKPNRLYWKASGAIFLGYGTFSITVMGTLFVGVILGTTHLKFNEGVLFWTIATSVISIFFGLLFTFPKGGTSKQELRRYKKNGFWILAHMNPFSAAFFVVYYAIIGVYYGLKGLCRYVVPRVPRAMLISTIALGVAAKMIGRFIARAFVYVHSKRRTLCFVDATIGAASGFFLGSAVVGAIIGAILGVVNYELIPARARAK